MKILKSGIRCRFCGEEGHVQRVACRRKAKPRVWFYMPGGRPVWWPFTR